MEGSEITDGGWDLANEASAGEAELAHAAGDAGDSLPHAGRDGGVPRGQSRSADDIAQRDERRAVGGQIRPAARERCQEEKRPGDKAEQQPRGPGHLQEVTVLTVTPLQK